MIRGESLKILILFFLPVFLMTPLAFSEGTINLGSLKVAGPIGNMDEKAGVSMIKVRPFYFYDYYQDVLNKCINENGSINLKKLNTASHNLDLFLNTIKEISENDIKKMTDDDQLAFWINTHNALSLSMLLNHPVEESLSINKKLKTTRYKITGKSLTLDIIKKNIIKKQFQQPKAYFALFDGTKNSPPIRKNYYTGDKLGLQLTEQVREYLNNPDHLQIDLNNSVVYLPAILKEHSNEFSSYYNTNDKYYGFNKRDRALLNFVYINSKNFKIDFLND